MRKAGTYAGCNLPARLLKYGEVVAELRNEGYVEEQVRGVIRLTPRGYRAYKNQSLPYAYRN